MESWWPAEQTTLVRPACACFLPQTCWFPPRSQPPSSSDPLSSFAVMLSTNLPLPLSHVCRDDLIPLNRPGLHRLRFRWARGRHVPALRPPCGLCKARQRFHRIPRPASLRPGAAGAATVPWATSRVIASSDGHLRRFRRARGRERVGKR